MLFKERSQFGLWAFFMLMCLKTAHGIEVQDDFDRLISLKSPAQRIISLAPHNTENLFSAGLGNRIIGIDENSQYPDSVKDIQSVGSAVQINIEAIIALNPDLIVAWHTAGNHERLKKLEQLGYTVYYSEPRTFEDVIRNITDLAVLGDTAENIVPLVDSLRNEIKEVSQLYQGLSEQTVFYQIWTQPLMTLNGDHFISRALELCSAKNVFESLPLIAPQISVESVIKANPDIIITGDSADSRSGLSLWETWSSVTAVEKSNYLYVDSDIMHRHTARMIMGIRKLCTGINEIRNKG